MAFLTMNKVQRTFPEKARHVYLKIAVFVAASCLRQDRRATITCNCCPQLPFMANLHLGNCSRKKCPEHHCCLMPAAAPVCPWHWCCLWCLLHADCAGTARPPHTPPTLLAIGSMDACWLPLFLSCALPFWTTLRRASCKWRSESH